MKITIYTKKFEFFLAYLLMRRPNCTNTDSEWLKSFRSINQKDSIQDISEEATQHPVSAFRHVDLHNERHIHLKVWRENYNLFMLSLPVPTSTWFSHQSDFFRGLTESTYCDAEINSDIEDMYFKLRRIFCILKECKLHFLVISYNTHSISISPRSSTNITCLHSTPMSYCKFCIYTHPVNSKFTIWHRDQWQLSHIKI